ncbi:hypothetical protein [Niallia taxi]|uniref:hypothetical protein n=1 Tax=Niallia taxi TaxID=2499688 RepID=UPI0015F4F2A9|nr:hypothetical protein [Niallia taxi]
MKRKDFLDMSKPQDLHFKRYLSEEKGQCRYRVLGVLSPHKEIDSFTGLCGIRLNAKIAPSYDRPIRNLSKFLTVK